MKNYYTVYGNLVLTKQEPNFGKRTKNEALSRFRSPFPDFCCSFIFHAYVCVCVCVCAFACVLCDVCVRVPPLRVLCAVCCQRVSNHHCCNYDLLSGEIYKYCTACCCTVRCVYCEVYCPAFYEFQTVYIRFRLYCEHCKDSTMHDA
jgi:hypothetical protein